MDTRDAKIPKHIQQMFAEKYYKKAVINEENIYRLKHDIHEYVEDLVWRGAVLDKGDLCPPNITITDENVVSVDIESMFKNFPKWYQEQLYCDIHNVPKEHIEKFNYNVQGYIESITLVESIKQIEIKIEIE